MKNRKPTASKRKLSTNPTVSSNRQVVLQQAETFSGPIPPPALFQAYEQILPGAADRILGLAEREQKQQHSIQKRVVEANIGSEKLGMQFGFGFQVMVIAGLYVMSFILIVKGKDTTALITLFTALAGSGAFIYRTQQAHKSEHELKKKKDK